MTRPPRTALLVSLGLVSGLMTGAPSLVDGQEQRVRILGRLVIGTDSVPAVGAHVVVGESPPTRTDSDGHFVLRAVPGEQRMTAVVIDGSRERIFTALFQIPDAGDVSFSWWVGPGVETEAGQSRHGAIPVEGLVVTVERRTLEMGHAAERGDYLGRGDIDALVGPAVRDVGDLARRLVGVDVVPSEGGTVCIVPRRGRTDVRALAPELERDAGLSASDDRGCPEMITVVLDGLVMRDAAHLVASIPPGDIQSLRYVGGISATQRYGRQGRWGALVIETRNR